MGDPYYRHGNCAYEILSCNRRNMRNTLLAVLAAVFYFPNNLHADGILGADVGAQAFFWQPAAIGGVSFKTEGLRGYNFHAGLWPGNSPHSGYALEVEYKAPFERTGKQADMLSANKSGAEGLEKFAFGIRPDEIAYTLKPSLVNNIWMKILLSTQYQYSKTVFYGNADVSDIFYYMGTGTVVDHSANTVSGALKLYPGTPLIFRTEFRENEINAAFYSLSKGFHEFRAGYFSLEWHRPSANNMGYSISDGVSAYPVVYDTRYAVKGFSLKWVSRDMTSPGLNGDIAVRFGLKSKIEQALPLELPEDENLTYIDYHLGGCYNWYFNKETRDGLFISVGGDAKLLGWFAEKKKTDNNSNSEGDQGPDLRLIDKETLYTVYLHGGFRF